MVGSVVSYIGVEQVAPEDGKNNERSIGNGASRVFDVKYRVRISRVPKSCNQACGANECNIGKALLVSGSKRSHWGVLVQTRSTTIFSAAAMSAFDSGSEGNYLLIVGEPVVHALC